MIVRKREARIQCFSCGKAINDFAVKKYCDDRCKDKHHSFLRKMSRSKIAITKKIEMINNLSLNGTREQKRVAINTLLDIQEMIRIALDADS